MSKGRGRARRLSSLEMQKLVHEAYAVHYVLLSLGFDSSEVFAGTANIANVNPPGLCATVELHAQGRRFVYTLSALVPGDDSRFTRYWSEFSQSQPTRDRAELEAIVQGSQAWKVKGALLGTLADKGFVFPAVEAEKEERTSDLGPRTSEGKEHVN